MCKTLLRKNVASDFVHKGQRLALPYVDDGSVCAYCKQRRIIHNIIKTSRGGAIARVEAHDFEHLFVDVVLALEITDK